MTAAENASQWLYPLMTWLSPSYPVGAYSYSHGLEWAVETGEVQDTASLLAWVEAALKHGGGRNDAILLAEAARARTAGDDARFADTEALAAALAGSRERRLETLSQGRAFLDVTAKAWGGVENGEVAYPIAVGAAVAAHGLPLRPALEAYLHAFAANIISAGVRLIPLGQSDGQRAVAALQPAVATLAAEAEAASPDEIGGCFFAGDIAAILHETQYTRLFRS